MGTNPRQLFLRYLLPLALGLIALLLALFDREIASLFRYDRSAILAGEWWRLLSGHLLHLGGPHLVMNLLGLGLVWMIVGSQFSALSWLLILVADALAISLGLLAFNPELGWYVGLSGVLHGMLVSGCVAELRRGRHSGWLILALVAGKLAWEQLAGPLPGSEASAGGTVVVDAHLYGALGGLLLGALLPLRREPQAASNSR